MKKIAIFALALLTVAGASAQETEKKEFKPQAGDWAVGVDMAPVFKFVGNVFNGSTDNGLDKLGGSPSVRTFDIRPDVSLLGKYMITDNFGIRANIGLKINTHTDRAYVQDDAALLDNPLSEQKVIDAVRTANHGGSILMGVEYRKGKRRVQGVFGGGILFAFSQNTTAYNYGNALTDVNQRPSVSDPSGAYGRNGYRLLKDYSNSKDFYTGLTGSAGFEWMVAPKVAFGMEVNLSLYYVFGAQRYTQSEGFNPSTGEVEIRTDLVSPGNNEFYFGTESLGGSLYMCFYF